MRGPTLSSGLLALASFVSAQVASVCPVDNVCFKLNIPESTASAGSGDIFFSISAPSSYEWVALGQGSGMANSNMFVVYTSESGSNVTLSPRSASGYNPPSVNADAEVTLLEGSSVSGGVMTANVKCSNCNSWSGGDMDFTSTSGNWIYAYQSSGGPKNSDDQSESIRQHDSQAVFSWDFANAKGGDSVNPLLASGGGTGTATATGGSPTCIPRPASTTGNTGNTVTPTPTDADSNDDSDNNSRYTSRWGGRPTTYAGPQPSSWPREKRQEENYCDENGSDGSSGDSDGSATPIFVGAVNQDWVKMLIAHGVLASLAFVILFPAGGIAIRLASFPGVVWLHAIFQVFAYIIYIAAAGLGAYLAVELDMLDRSHVKIGFLVLALLFVQPITGLLHHIGFKKYSSRTWWSHSHIWLGRIAVTLGIINGGLGLELADTRNMSSEGGMIAYGVIAGVIWLAWVAAIVIGERRRSRAQKDGPPEYPEQPRAGSDTGLQSNVTPPAGYYANQPQKDEVSPVEEKYTSNK